MSAVPSERKSWGPLIAMIDLLFLVVAFFTLLLFFVQKERDRAQVRVNRMQETLAAAMPQDTAPSPERQGNAMVNFVERLMAIQKEEQDRQAQAQQRDERRRLRPVERVNYQVLAGGSIVYEGRTYRAGEFKSEVVDRARQTHWLAIRAYAPPETPFGDVVAMRKLLLENGGEFDTYWDNLAEGAAAPRASNAAKPRSP
jgi:hypothetical protein